MAVRRALAGWAASLLLLGGCQPHAETLAAGPIRSGGLTFTVNPGQADRTLGSLRRLDDHPLYEMTYEGSSPRVARLPSSAAASAGARRGPYGCTVFLAAGDPARPVVGRNFDWDRNPALLLVSRPRDGFDSISLVDMSYLGFDAGHLDDLDDARKRRALLRAPALPFDGLNEYGLAVGMAAVDDGSAVRRPGTPVIGSLAVIRLALDTTRTVDEAIAVFSSYEIDFTGGPPLHYLIADAGGGSAVVEFVAGQMRVVRRTGSWQLMTNFHLSTSGAALRDADWRWRTGSTRLDQAGGRFDPDGALGLLREVRQGHTQWSVAYDLRAGTAAIVTAQQYARVHHASLR
ncbi:MAG TPA: C45 family peptidase [Pilimelia sp.]|nr:C45 family peptidase [Pilimelia sp.]